jgi:hypothetical protein
MQQLTHLLITVCRSTMAQAGESIGKVIQRLRDHETITCCCSVGVRVCRSTMAQAGESDGEVIQRLRVTYCLQVHRGTG